MNIIIVGQGGHSQVICDLIFTSTKHNIIGFLDDKYDELTLNNGDFYGPVYTAPILLSRFSSAKLMIAIGNNKVRQRIVDQLDLPSHYYISLIHKSAEVSPTARIGHGTVIMPHAVVNAHSEIGNQVIVNTSAVVEHDNVIGDFAHISPQAALTGNVKIDEGVHIGAGANVIPGIHIGEWTVVGAGATVIGDLPSYQTAVGVPAKLLNKTMTEGA